jgi:hypothetical protein
VRGFWSTLLTNLNTYIKWIKENLAKLKNNSKSITRDTPIIMKEIESVVNPSPQSTQRGLQAKPNTCKTVPLLPTVLQRTENREYSYLFLYHCHLSTKPDKDSIVWEKPFRPVLLMNIDVEIPRKELQTRKIFKRWSTSWKPSFIWTKPFENLICALLTD